jgi:hypothetical protein
MKWEDFNKINESVKNLDEKLREMIHASEAARYAVRELDIALSDLIDDIEEDECEES